jgi:CubicO group peptidase (beta-lactamase class C family)
MKLRLIFSICFFLPFISNGQMSTDKDKNIKKFEEFALLAGTPALQIAYWDAKNVDLYAIGKKDASKPDLIDNETIFQAASLTKVVAAYLYLILYDKGLFDLDKPLSSYYNYERLSEDKHKDLITARHVLTHSSGMVNWEKGAGTAGWETTKIKTLFKPGERFMYSGEAMFYLQKVVEHLTGKSLTQLCKEHIFEPFGMKNSSMSWLDRFEGNISIAHRDINKSFGYIHKFKDSNAAYTMYTTAADYMTFILNGVLQGKGLSKKVHDLLLKSSYSALQRNDVLGGYNKKRACHGVMQQINEQGTAYCHTGSNGGFRCAFIIYPDKKQAVALFTNSNDGTNARKMIFKYIFGNHHTYWGIM